MEAVDRRRNQALIEAAGAEGVRRFVFVSALSASADSPVPFLLSTLPFGHLSLTRG